MNRAEKAVEQAKLDREKAVLEELQEHYEYALNSINERLRVLQAAPETQSNVYHIQYQKTMQKQVSDILANLRANEYNTIDQYMHDAYTTGYVGTMYSLHNQGMPLTIPINQDAVVKAVQHNTKLTSPLYDELGLDVKKMQKGINRELSRGLSSGLTYDEIARNIKQTTKAPLARAKLIARTEGHRIHEESSYDAAVAAKAEGADLVKQWDATMDGDTRPNHKQLDTQIRELEEPFEVGTFKPMHPGDFGTAKEDCNCRCVSLKRARWALDEAELEEMKERAKQFGLDKSAEFAEFEKKYLKASEEEVTTAPIPQKADDAKPAQQPGGNAAPAVENTPAKTPQTIENSGESGIMEAGGVLDNFDRKTQYYEVSEDLKAVNPNYATGEYKWRNNCQRCVSAYELRRRGYDVTAKPLPGKLDDDYLAQWFEHAWENAERKWCLSGSGKKQVEDYMKQWGNGARAVVGVGFTPESGHVFFVELIDGKAVYVDPQNPSADCSAYFKQAMKGRTHITRVDNLQPSDHIVDCCENRR